MKFEPSTVRVKAVPEEILFGDREPTAGRGFVTDALYRMPPDRDADPPSQCCVKSAAKLTTVLPEKTASRTVNSPLSVLQPRPSPEMLKPTWLADWNGYRTAFKYVPGTSGALFGAAKSTYHQMDG